MEHTWNILKKGNDKWIKSSQELRKNLTISANPKALILTCIDSRTAPEHIFQQKAGDILTIRVAGGVIDPMILGSIEFALTSFAIELIVIVGHSFCVAIQSALNHLKSNNGIIVPTSSLALNAIMGPIQKAIIESGLDINAPDALEQAIRTNVNYTSQQLLTNDVIYEAVKKRKTKIIGAKYCLTSGHVSRLFDLSD